MDKIISLCFKSGTDFSRSSVQIRWKIRRCVYVIAIKKERKEIVINTVCQGFYDKYLNGK